MRLYLDLETRSHCDLSVEGTVRYAAHKTTEVTAIGYCTSDGEQGCITKGEIIAARELGIFSDNLQRLLQLIKEADYIVAHNAFFEIIMWSYLLEDVLGPVPAIKFWRDTMVKVQFYSLPRALKTAAIALKLDDEKDDEGYAVMMAMCSPNKFTGKYLENPDMWKKLYAYCTQDTVVSRSIDQYLRDLPQEAERLWQVTMGVNLRGAQADILLCKAAISLVDSIKKPAIAKFKRLIGVNPTQGVALLQRLQVLCDITALNKVEVKRVMESFDTPEVVKEVLTQRALTLKSATAKFKKVLEIEKDGKVFNYLIAFGAHTHRFTSQDVQLQNMKRPDEGVDMLKLVKRIKNLDLTLTLEEVSQAVRGIFHGDMTVVDYSQMEAKIAAWITGEEKVLEQFRSGKDVYCSTATDIYGYEVTKKHKTERTNGKVSRLAYQYGGGIGAMINMAGQYGVNLESVLPILDTANGTEMLNANKTFDWCVKYKKLRAPRDIGLACDVLKQRWRLANPNIVSYWKKLQNAFEDVLLDEDMATIATVPGPYGEVKVFRYQQFTVMRLPSGTCRFYPYMSAKPTTQKEKEEGELGDYTFRYFKIDKGQLARTFTYGGKLFENLVQAIMSDLFNEAFVAADDAGIDLFLGVHDEIAAYGFVQEKLEKIMLHASDRWTEGLPIGVEGYESTVYRK